MDLWEEPSFLKLLLMIRVADGVFAVFGIVDMRGSPRPVLKRLRTLLFAIPLLSNTVSSETGLVKSGLFEVALRVPALEAWYGRNENLTVGER